MQSYAQENAGEEHYEGKQDFGDWIWSEETNDTVCPMRNEVEEWNNMPRYDGIYCHVFEWPQAVFRLEIRFIGLLYTRLVSTFNYSAIGDLHISQITTAHAKSFPACSVSTSRFPVTASNSGDPAASALVQFLVDHLS
jgi:hypothetical protein